MMTPAEVAALRPRSREIYRLCQRLGLTVIRSGCAWRVHGQGVDVLAAELSLLNELDLRREGALGTLPRTAQRKKENR